MFDFKGWWNAHCDSLWGTLEDRDEVYPEPSLIGKEGKGWKVLGLAKATQAYVDMSKKIMVVPVGSKDYHMAIRLHELLHIKFSPKSYMADSKMKICIECAEDGRINFIGSPECLDLDMQYAVGREPKSKAISAMDKLGVLPVAISQIGSPLEELCLRYLGSAGSEEGILVRYQIFYTCREIIYKKPFSFETTKKVAEILYKYLNDDSDEDEEDSSSDPSDKKPRMAKATFSDPIPSDLKPKVEALMMKEESGGMDKSAIKSGYWGEMELMEPKMTQRMTGYLSRVFRPVEEGVVYKNPSRFCTDKMIFGTRKSHLGGTVVIDCSGSMHLNKDEILSVMKEAPRSDIYLYGAPGGRNGYLVKVASNGKRVDDSMVKSPGGGNVIDGPVLEYLGKCNPPRIWVCDGRVTGIGDDTYVSCTTDAQRLEAFHEITRADNVPEAIRIIRKLNRQRK